MRFLLLSVTIFASTIISIPASAQFYRCQPQVTGPIWQIYNGIDPYARTTRRSYPAPMLNSGMGIVVESPPPAVAPAPPVVLQFPPSVIGVDNEQRSPSDIPPEELVRRIQQLNDAKNREQDKAETERLKSEIKLLLEKQERSQQQLTEARKAEAVARMRMEESLQQAKNSVAKARDQQRKSRIEADVARKSAAQQQAEFKSELDELKTKLKVMEAQLAKARAATKKPDAKAKAKPAKPAKPANVQPKKTDPKKSKPKKLDPFNNDVADQIKQLEKERDKQIEQFSKRSQQRAEARIKRLKESDKNFEQAKKKILENVEKQIKTNSAKIRDRFRKKIESLRKGGGK